MFSPSFLLGGGAEGPLTLNADTTFLQQRVTGICVVGSSIRIINDDGTVSCEIDDGGLSGDGTANQIAKFTGAGVVGNSGIIEDDLGNIGIGAPPRGDKHLCRDSPVPSP